MNLKDKRFLPYYITAAVIIICAFAAVAIINISHRVQEETTTTQPSPEFISGDIPYYENIPASAYSKDKFTEEDGRMIYTDTDVNYYTGIDVSSYQGEIDWNAVAADGIDFAIIRVGYRGYGTAGNIRIDESADINIKAASQAGLKIGVYFYSQATTVAEAEEEADFVINAIKNYDIDYPVVFDWENDPGVGMRTDGMTAEETTPCAVAFCEKIKAAGYTPAVYFNLSDAYDRYNLDAISDYSFWYAQFEGEAPEFYYEYSIWQYSDSGTVDGIKGKVDLNICFTAF
ncbi:MAG: glycoside hydrolase family 25 protein [Clostridia bacterium]|nr:glycoside hydrolase family 25 protein [Clostridia bacterium]